MLRSCLLDDTSFLIPICWIAKTWQCVTVIAKHSAEATLLFSLSMARRFWGRVGRFLYSREQRYWLLCKYIHSDILGARTMLTMTKPILTPLLLTAQTYFQPPTIPSDAHTPSRLTHTIRGSWLAAIPSVWSLSNGDLLGSLVSLILVVSLLVVYTILLPDFRVPRLSLSSVDIEATIKTVAFRTNILLVAGIVFQRIFLGPPTTDVLSLLISGFFKAASWFFTIQTVRACDLQP